MATAFNAASFVSVEVALLKITMILTLASSLQLSLMALLVPKTMNLLLTLNPLLPFDPPLTLALLP